MNRTKTKLILLRKILESLLRIEQMMTNEQTEKGMVYKDLTKKRVKAQMKQKELARLMSVSVNEIKAWESQEKIPNAEQAEMLEIIFKGR